MSKISLGNAKPKVTAGRFRSRYLPLYIMILPVMVYYILMVYKPMAGLVIAFQDYNVFKGILGSEWVGLKHFITFFKTPTVGRLFRNTLMLNIWNMVFSFPLPIIFALLLNEVKNAKLKKSIQTLTYMPHFISIVVAAGIIINLLAPGYGVITQFAKAITGKDFFFATMPEAFRPTYIGLHIWKELGYSSIVYLSAIAGVDAELYEAAAIDGASKFKRIWHITIPGIAPTIITLFILKMGNMLASGTDTIILLYQPATYEVSDVIGTYVYRFGLVEGNYSFSTAVGIFNSIVALILVGITNTISNKVAKVGLW